jgi:phage-related protein
MPNGGFRTLGVSFRIGFIFILSMGLGATHAHAQQQVVGKNSAQPVNTSAGTTDATREELANFDRFLDNHPILEQELGSNPSLVNDPNYVQREPDLQIFLSHHPAVKAQMERDPQYLAQRKDLAETNSPNHESANASLDRSEADQMTGFLNAHGEIKDSLKENPALIDDSTYLSSHPDLQIFVNQHPRARYEFVQNPRYFIAPDNRSALPPAPVAARPKPTPVKPVAPDEPEFNFGVSGNEVARMDQFLEDNPKIARDLEKDPLLVTNHKYLDHHRELRRFFDEHVRVREAFAEDPRYFVPGNGFGASQPPLQVSTERRLSDRDLADVETFLHKHKDVAKGLQRDPMAVQDLRYLHRHGDFREFLDQHPHIQTELEEHPRYFMRRIEQFQQNENLEVQNHRQ